MELPKRAGDNPLAVELEEGKKISLQLDTISDAKQRRYDLIFNSLDYSDTGVYTCHASLTVDRNSVLFNGNGSANTTVGILSKLKLLKFIA